MQYMLLIYGDEKARPSDLPPEAMQQEMQAWFQYSDWLREQGWMVAGDALHDTDHATTVRVRTARRSPPTARSPRPRSSSAATTCSSARTSTRRSTGRGEIPGPRYGSIEVRPVMEFDGAARGAGSAALSASRARGRRPPVPAGVGTGGRDPDPRPRRLRPRRGGRPGRVRGRRSSAGRATACRTTPAPGSRPTARNRAIDRLRRERERCAGKPRRARGLARARARSARTRRTT